MSIVIKKSLNIKIILRSMLAHFLIFFLMLLLLSIAVNPLFSALSLLIIILSYFYSGFVITRIKTNWYNYFGIAIFGLIIWLVSFISSPNSLNYKSDDSAGLWMFYRVYIAAMESPITFMGLNIAEEYSIKAEMYSIAIIPILASLLQYSGGLLKIRNTTNKFRMLTSNEK